MASISGINSYLYNDYNNLSAIINTSTERFKGSVTGYKPVERTSSSNSASALSAEQTKSYLADLNEVGGKLRTAVENLSAQSGQDLFNQRTAVSSKEDALSVSVSDQAEAAQWANTQERKSVTISQLATAQKNVGAALNSTDLSGAAQGSNQFTIEKEGKSHHLSVNIKQTDSVRTAQQKMADAINDQGIGIAASVVYNDQTQQSSLVLTSKETGEANAFSIADLQGQGNLVSALGVGQATQEAQNALYTVNGVNQTSAQNTVDLGSGITGTLKKATAEEITVDAPKDVAGISSAMSEAVNSFNSLRQITKEYGDDKGAQSLMQRMDAIASSYASSLSNLGITRDQEGYLKIDEEKLQTAFENGSAERFLGDSNAGFTQRLSQLAKSVDTNPDQFVSYRSRNNMNGESAGTSTNAINSAYNFSYNNYLFAYRDAQLTNLGLLFSTEV